MPFLISSASSSERPPNEFGKRAFMIATGSSRGSGMIRSTFAPDGRSTGAFGLKTPFSNTAVIVSIIRSPVRLQSSDSGGNPLACFFECAANAIGFFGGKNSPRIRIQPLHLGGCRVVVFIADKHRDLRAGSEIGG